jgi:hypothetical protein
MDSRDGYQDNSAFCRMTETECNNGKRYFSKDGTCILLLATGMDMHGAMAEDLFAFGC